jgi:5'-methylthioadenosine phosphorylase
MTNLPEAKLAREASISYATLAMATDYDCWHEGHDDVTVVQVVAVIRANVNLAKKIIAEAVPIIADHDGPPPHHDALKGALLTPAEAIDPERRRALAPLIGHVL